MRSSIQIAICAENEVHLSRRNQIWTDQFPWAANITIPVNPITVALRILMESGMRGKGPHHHLPAEGSPLRKSTAPSAIPRRNQPG